MGGEIWGKRKIQFWPIQTLLKEVTAAIVLNYVFKTFSNKTSTLKMYTNFAFPCDFWRVRNAWNILFTILITNLLASVVSCHPQGSNNLHISFPILKLCFPPVCFMHINNQYEFDEIFHNLISMSHSK